FWAIRGAGANFGVVTEFVFRLHEVGPLVLGGLLDMIVDAPSPRSHVIVTQLGGAVSRVPQTATAFAQREGAYLAWVISIWERGQAEETNLAWGRRARGLLEPFGAGGTYVNALEPDAGQQQQHPRTGVVRGGLDATGRA